MTQPLNTFASHENAEAYLIRCGFKHAGDDVWKYGRTKYRAYLTWFRGTEGQVPNAPHQRCGYHVSYWPEFPPDEAHKSLRDRIGGRAWL